MHKATMFLGQLSVIKGTIPQRYLYCLSLCIKRKQFLERNPVNYAGSENVSWATANERNISKAV